MKVFFNRSSRSDGNTKLNSETIYKLLVKLGYTHTYQYLEKDIKYSHDLDENRLEELYLRIVRALPKSDIIILEISTNSFTQGYIVQKALEMAKPVIALHQKSGCSIFVKGIKNNLIQIVEYDEYTLERNLKQALDFAVENLMTKFNFYLSSDINNYLNWVSKSKKLHKSEVVRDLIRKQMDTDHEYIS